MSRSTSSLLLTTVLLLIGLWAPLVGAEERSFYSPIIAVDREKGWIIISDSGAVFAVEAPEAAKPHLGELPEMGGMIDVVVDTRDGKPPLIRTWKVTAGESSCKHFDGKGCR
jgi:hypothetical protein